MPVIKFEYDVAGGYTVESVGHAQSRYGRWLAESGLLAYCERRGATELLWPAVGQTHCHPVPVTPQLLRAQRRIEGASDTTDGPSIHVNCLCSLSPVVGE